MFRHIFEHGRNEDKLPRAGLHKGLDVAFREPMRFVNSKADILESSPEVSTHISCRVIFIADRYFVGQVA